MIPSTIKVLFASLLHPSQQRLKDGCTEKRGVRLHKERGYFCFASPSGGRRKGRRGMTGETGKQQGLDGVITALHLSEQDSQI